MRSGLLAIGASILALSLSSCASAPDTEYRMLPTGDHGVGVRFSRGNAAMISSGNNGSVMLIPIRYNAQNRLYFSLAALNTGGRPSNFGTEHVRIWVDGDRPVRVQDFNILRRDMRHQAQRELNSAWISAALDGYFAYQENSNRPNSREIAYRYAAGSYAYSQSAILSRLNFTLRDMGRTVLQTSTVDPGTTHAGWVFADQLVIPERYIRRLTVAVNFAGEEHRFAIDLASSSDDVGLSPNIPAVTWGEFDQVYYGQETYQWTEPRPLPPRPVVIH